MRRLFPLLALLVSPAASFWQFEHEPVLFDALEHALCFSSACDLRDLAGGKDATLVNGANCTSGVGVELDGTDD